MQKNYDIRVIEDYEVHFKSIIGQGAYGKVYEGRKISENRTICVKVVFIKQDNIEKIKREVSLLEEIKKVTHPNIVKIYQIEEQNQRIYIFMEKCVESLEQKLQKMKKEKKCFSVREILLIAKQICRGYNEIRKKNMIHRDLKPENILIGEDGCYKICDFNLSKTTQNLESIMQQTQVGTPLFVAPQIFNGQYSNKADIFSLGMTLFYITFQKSLFHVNSIQDLEDEYDRLKKGLQIPEIWNQDDKKLQDELKTILQMTITYNEEDRISWDELTGILEELDLRSNNYTFSTKKNEQEEFENQSFNNYLNLPKINNYNPEPTVYSFLPTEQIYQGMDASKQPNQLKQQFENIDNQIYNQNIQYQFGIDQYNQQDNNNQYNQNNIQSYQRQSNSNLQYYQPNNQVQNFYDNNQDYHHEQDKMMTLDISKSSQSFSGKQIYYEQTQQQQVQDFEQENYVKYDNQQNKVSQKKILIQESKSDYKQFPSQEPQKQIYLQNNNQIYQVKNQEEEEEIFYQDKQFQKESANQLIQNLSLVESLNDLNQNSIKNIQKSQLTKNQKINDQSQNNLLINSRDFYKISQQVQKESLTDSTQNVKQNLQQNSSQNILQNLDESQTINFSSFLGESQMNLSKTNQKSKQTLENPTYQIINLKSKNLIQNNQKDYPFKQDDQKEQIFNHQKIAQTYQKDNEQPIIQQPIQNLTKQEFYSKNQQEGIKKNQNYSNYQALNIQDEQFADNQSLIKQQTEQKFINDNLSSASNNSKSKGKLIKVVEVTKASFDLKKIVLIIFAKIKLAENAFNSYQKLKKNQQFQKYSIYFEIFNYLLLQYQFSMIANINLICTNDQNMDQSVLKKELDQQIVGKKIVDYQNQNQNQLKEIDQIYQQKLQISSQASEELYNLFKKRDNNNDLIELITFLGGGDFYNFEAFIRLYENYFKEFFKQVKQNSNIKDFLKFFGFSIKLIRIEEQYPIKNYTEIDYKMIDYLTDDEQLLQEFIKGYETMRLKND